MARTPSHETCDRGLHQKPVGEACRLCAANPEYQRELRAERRQDKIDERLDEITGGDGG